MKKLLFFLSLMFLITSCSVTLPLQTNLSENTLLLSKSKDDKVIQQFLKLNFAGIPQSQEHIEFVKDISKKL